MDRMKLAIVVDSFDGYSDIWPAFFEVFQKNWGDCCFPLYLVSNKKEYAGVQTITTGEETCWSERTLFAVRQIESEYVLLLLEDYLLGDRVLNERVEQAIQFMIEKNAKYLRLTNIPKSRFNQTNEEIFCLYADEEYAINLQASIWKRDYLIAALEKFSGTAWEFEVGFLKEATNKPHYKLEGCFGMEHDPLYVRNGVLKGKWFPSTISYFKKNGININWRNRGKLSFIQNVKYNLMVALKNSMSYETRKKIKRILQKLGVKFVSDL